MPLTDTSVKNAKPRDDGKVNTIPDGNSLYLWVMANGSKYWRMTYRFAGKQKTLALGVYPDTSLKQAREKRDEAKKLLADGIDPSIKRRSDKLTAMVAAANTFEAIAKEWHAKESHEWSAVHAQRVMSAMEQHIFPFIGHLPVADIKPLELLEVLRKVSHAEGNKVRAAYNRAEYMEERRNMMKWWAGYIESIKDGGKVIPFPTRAA